MRATITKIDPPKASKYQATFIRIYFNGDDGKWYQTDVVPVYRNYKNWKPVLESGVGTVVDGLQTKWSYGRIGNSKIDADSPVIIVGKIKEKVVADQQTLL